MANVFSGDPNCVALWRFESGALTTDSIGTNTLTDFNTVGVNTSEYKEGSASADLEASNDECFYITDANLSSDFPLKDGDTNKKISVCCWARAENLGSYAGFFGKFENTSGKYCIKLLWGTTGPSILLQIGHTGGTATETLYDGGSLSTNRWYHLAVTFDDSDKSWKLVVWDDTAGSKIINASGTATNNISISDAPFLVGDIATSSGTPQGVTWDGELDEFVVFKDILTSDEIDEIRAGTYDFDVEVSATCPSFTLTPYAAGIIGATTVNASVSAFTLTTYDADVFNGVLVTADSVSFTLTPYAADIVHDVNLLAECTAFTLTPNAATISYDTTILPAVVSFTIATYDAEIWDGAAWAAWISANGDRLTYLYYFVLTGDADGTTDVTIPISSFQARRKSGAPTFLSVVAPGLDYQDDIGNRTNGEMQVHLAYILDGVEQYREIIVRADYEEMRVDEGGRNKSITITGHKTESFTSKSMDLRDVVYVSDDDGLYNYRCASLDIYLNPGDTARYDGNEITVNQIVYYVAVGQQSMNVNESEI